jgi:alpha-mannosidase/mannosylglycerate hydrolase
MSNTADKPFRAHYISGTHWDREWYRPFQEFRLLLVEVMDDLLDLLDRDPEFKHFHLDGQTCVLKDYLEIRPEEEPRLKRHIADGRILIGPWFTMPDLFATGQEALVRNLLLGKTICEEWGVQPMATGYVCDMFGHNSQAPQLFRGFGITRAVMGRGANEHTTPTFFTWRAPNGDEAFTFKLQDRYGYAAFAQARHILEAPDADDDPTAEERATKTMEEYARHETSRANGTTIALFDSMDHMPPASNPKRYLDLLRGAYPELEAVHSSLPAFFDEAERTATDLPTRVGELREPAKGTYPYLWLIPNCGSSRVRLKQANDRCERLLASEAEPFAAFARALGDKTPRRLFRTAWEYALLNHAHDSICGCSIDQTHRDMSYRYDQAEILATQLRNRAVGFLASTRKDPSRGEREFAVVLSNPLPRARKEPIVFAVDLPTDYPTQFTEGFPGSQNVKSFTLHTVEGEEIPYQRLSIDPRHQERTRYALTTTEGGDGVVTRYVVAAEIDLPALGFVAVRVRESDAPVRYHGSMRTGPASAENDSVAVAINPNGTFRLTDKATGETYDDLLIYEDDSEIGSGWFHSFTVNDETISTAAGEARLSVIDDGPELVRFAIRRTLALPKRYDWRDERRTDERVEATVTDFLTLKRTARYIEIETVVENVAEDHRLRALFPTDVEADTYLAHTAFDVVERPIARDRETFKWQEYELVQKPFLGFIAIGAGKRGLAFVSGGGFREGGVREDERRTMEATFLRSFRRTVGTPGERDGLELGEIRYRYALMPFAGERARQRALDLHDRLSTEIVASQTGKIRSGFPPLTGEEPARASFLELEIGALALAAIKTSEDGEAMVVRLWNPTDEEQTERLRFFASVKEARYVDLAERPSEKGEPSVDANVVVATASGKSIVSVRVAL